MLLSRRFALKSSRADFWGKAWLTFFTLAIMLSACGPAALPDQPVTIETPAPVLETTERGKGDLLRIFSPDAATLLNPHLSSSGQDLEASRITYEPLASFGADGKLVPFLAAEIPDKGKGVADDNRSVTWQLKQGVFWSDGEPFTAADVVFTYKFITNPDVKAVTASSYSNVEDVIALDDYTIKVVFKDKTPGWYVPFVGWAGVILPRHAFEAYNGKNVGDAPANALPIGTGPYRVVAPGIKPQEVWFLGSQLIKTTKIVFEANPHFREANQPYFKKIELLGGGRSDEAEVLVLDEGIMDVAFVRGQLKSESLTKLDSSNQVKYYSNFGSIVERILLNRTDPNVEVDGEKSSIKTEHPLFKDERVRQAIAYAIDREAIVELYGPAGERTDNNLAAPPAYNSPNTFYTYDLDTARRLLDEAGWVDTNQDGVREKDGVKMEIVYQTFTGAVAQQTQAIVKKSLNEIGIAVTLKIVDTSKMFGPVTDPAIDKDKDRLFPADLMSESFGNQSPYPSAYMGYWTCEQIPQASNNWNGLNLERWCNPEYQALYKAAATTIDEKESAQLFIKMNDLLIKDVVMIPIAVFSYFSIIAKQDIQGIELTPWDMNTWNIKDWRQTSP